MPTVGQLAPQAPSKCKAAYTAVKGVVNFFPFFPFNIKEYHIICKIKYPSQKAYFSHSASGSARRSPSQGWDPTGKGSEWRTLL